MSYQTKNNPGALTKRQKTRLLYYVKRIGSSLGAADYRGARNYFLSEGVNIWNDRLPYLQIGKTCECNICGYHGRFAHKSNRLGIAWDSICPNCDSRSRHRALFLLYQKLIPKDQSILHFAPEPILTQLFKGNKFYKTADLFLEDVDFSGEDIQNLTFDSATFDWVLCNHVLEHVPDDGKAMRNVSRILKEQGQALITIPGDYKRKETVLFNDLSLNGHYRDYGLDVIKRLEEVFRLVDFIDLSLDVSPRLAISPGERAFLCKK